jgi:hypothetical protein
VWQGQPVSGVTMTFEGVAYERADGVVDERAVTDEAGMFVFRDIPEGYFYELHADLETDPRPSGLQNESLNADVFEFELPSDTNLNLGNYYLFATDLRLISPEYGSTLNNTAPLLRWEAYEGAASYRVELKQLYASYTDVTMETMETEVQIQGPLMECTYGWDVTALDEDGNPIARADTRIEDENTFFTAHEADFRAEYDGLFDVRGEDLPWCQLELTVPGLLQHFDLEDGWEVSWELHPLAAFYRVMVRQVEDEHGDPHVNYFSSNQMAVDEDGRPVDPQLPTLPAGLFQLYVIAYDTNANTVAQSEVVYFIIE